MAQGAATLPTLPVAPQEVSHSRLDFLEQEIRDLRAQVQKQQAATDGDIRQVSDEVKKLTMEVRAAAAMSSASTAAASAATADRRPGAEEREPPEPQLHMPRSSRRERGELSGLSEKIGCLAVRGDLKEAAEVVAGALSELERLTAVACNALEIAAAASSDCTVDRLLGNLAMAAPVKRAATLADDPSGWRSSSTSPSPRPRRLTAPAEAARTSAEAQPASGRAADYAAARGLIRHPPEVISLGHCVDSSSVGALTVASPVGGDQGAAGAGPVFARSAWSWKGLKDECMDTTLAAH